MLKYQIFVTCVSNKRHPESKGKVYDGYTSDFQVGHKLRILTKEGDKIISLSKVVKKTGKNGSFTIKTKHGSTYCVVVQSMK